MKPKLFGCSDNVCILSQLLINFITHTCCIFSISMVIGCQMSSRYAQNKDTYIVAMKRIACFVKYLLVPFVVICLSTSSVCNERIFPLKFKRANDSHCATVCEYMNSCYVRKCKRFVRENCSTHSVASIIMDTTKPAEKKLSHIL